ncbi:hypothetical protein N7533_002241 [Penicillium manginii]|uniref:uncharacterized protein n=1 Tax=Penicillium manginii TaxID=203109 RepID=UPI00254845BD|nr:uncharacterized protein N7533_002241 [Penicillium manginii]KAJ5763560.1 hypothetical protein N7533_002241 [Penicillium manginii]
MASSDYPMGSMSPTEELIYPDIDESIHYPWQDDQQIHSEGFSASVIDPRLYQGLAEQNDELAVDQVQPDYEDQMNHLESNGFLTDEDSGSEYNEEDASESNDSDEYPIEDDSEDSGAARRRRRRGGGRFSGRYGARGGKGIKRGPRKPIEPSPEFKILHSDATSAFIDGDYGRAIELVMRAIQINPEMFPAHSLLSEIFLAQGEKDKALAALWNGAHTRPKDTKVWLQVARLILGRAGIDRESALPDVVYCYSRIIEIDHKNFNIRFQRAAVYRELGYTGRAAGEYERILKEKPYSIRALRHLAEIHIDLNDIERALEIWSESILFYRGHSEKVRDFSWSDVNIYAELFGYVNRHAEGLAEMKTLSRWFLGRKNDDPMWEKFEDDDREWDSEHSPVESRLVALTPTSGL